MTIKLAENLQLLRKEKGLTQEALAEVFGVTSQSVSKWELGLSCPDITVLPEIAEYFQVSIDELMGYKPSSSINSVYIGMKSVVDNAEGAFSKPDYAYRLSRLAATTLWSKQATEVDKLLKGNKTNALSYGQGDGGVSICGENTLFIASFKDFPKYELPTIKKVHKYLNKICDINTLKVMFGLFNMMLENTIVKSWTLGEISNYTKLDEDIVMKALDNLDAYFDEESYKEKKEEKYSLKHVDQVPILVSMLIPVLEDYGITIK
ncbi:MAG: helix-turn-helix transcriptional regulator [Bacilli bacterium]|nr:helix-turn-helix transcriptional regulator [Bacilli bacterium]